MTKERNSSIELFRILAAFSVLIGHFNGWFLGDLAVIQRPETISGYGQTLIASLCAVCINCFIIISGYFGIRLRLKTLWNFIIQLLGIFVPLYLISCLIGVDVLSIKTLIHNLLPISRGGYFVQCYFLLLLVSPFLNALFETKKRQAVIISILLVLVELWLDCIWNEKSVGVEHGYAFTHFMVIYCCGRCISIFKERLLKVHRWKWMVGYFVLSLMVFGLSVVGISPAMYYSSPLVIGATVCAFMPFLYKTYTNKVINWIATGCFAVYIIQVVNPTFPLLCRLDRDLFLGNAYPVYLLKVGAVIVVFFMFCILYDKIRAWLTKPLDKYCYPKVEKTWELTKN